MTLISQFDFAINRAKQQQLSDKIKTNEVSVVIPVKNNQKGIDTYLRCFFDSHKQSEFPKEIVIVDNDSSPAIKIKSQFKEKGLDIKLLRCLTPGPAAARNKGAAIVRGKWLLFNDSDCIPTKSILKGYINADNLSVAYAGNIKALGQDSLSKYYESQEILIPLKVVKEDKQLVPQYLITANSLIWKLAFDEIKGFNEKIGIAAGEDVDLGLRLSEIGTLSYAFDSIAIHDFSDGFIGFIKRFIRYGQGNRLVEEIWDSNLRPKAFKPNKKSFRNKVFAGFQYLFLTIGYVKQDRKLRKYGW